MPPNRRRRRRGHESGEDSEERSRSPCPEDKEHDEAKPASAQTLLEASSSLPPASQAEALPQVSVSRIWQQTRHDWGRRFYVRLDLKEKFHKFHTYPDVGGPFQNLEEIDKAIDCYLEVRWDPKMREEQDMAIKQYLYWPDGTVKRRSTSLRTVESEMRHFVQAIVDKYNEDNGLFKDRAHELKDVLNYQAISEKLTGYCHFNFTTKIKGAGPNESSMDNLIFVEVKFMKQGKFKERVVNCFCTVNPSDNGRCYACTRAGNDGMKHPNSSVYTAGQLDVGSSFRYLQKTDYEDEHEDEDDDTYVKAREAELREALKIRYEPYEPGDEDITCTPPPTPTRATVPSILPPTTPTTAMVPSMPSRKARPTIHKFYTRRGRNVLKIKNLGVEGRDI